MANKRIVYPIGISTPGAKSALEKWFSTDIIPDLTANLSTIFTLHYAISVTDSVIEYTIDGGTTYQAFDDGNHMIESTGKTREIIIDKGEAFNMRAVEAVTVNFAKVYLV